MSSPNNSLSKSIVIVVPYFGSWPEWFSIFLETTRWNPCINWLFFSDCGTPRSAPSNVSFVEMTLNEFCSLAAEKIQLDVRIERPYKLCDYKLAYGHIFEDYLRDYDYFGFGDIDLVYGDLRRFLPEEAFEYDIITFAEKVICGHLTLLRNSSRVRTLYRFIENYEEKLLDPRNRRIAELNLTPDKLLTEDCPQEILDTTSIYTMESFTTPHTLRGGWIDGLPFPEEWTWSRGILNTVPAHPGGFPYFHFLHWKSGGGSLRKYFKPSWRELERIVYLNEDELSRGFMVSLYGFHPLDERRPVKYTAPIFQRMLERVKLGYPYWSPRKLAKQLLGHLRTLMALPRNKKGGMPYP